MHKTIKLSTFQREIPGIMLFALFILGVILRGFDYLPLDTLIAEITVLLLCGVFHLERLNYIDKYNTAGDEELKKRAKEKSTHFKTMFVVYIFVVAYGFHDMYSTQVMLRDEESFICKQRGGFEIYVNKSEGWELKENHFIKGKSKIYALKCIKAEQ